MGAEALCRGAAIVIGIEKAGMACRIIERNWQQVASSDQSYTVMRADVKSQLPKLTGQQFHHIYFDPPYQGDLYEVVIRAIADHGLLAADGELAVEHEVDGWEAITVPGLWLKAQKHYGRTCLSFYTPIQDANEMPSSSSNS